MIQNQMFKQFIKVLDNFLNNIDITKQIDKETIEVLKDLCLEHGANTEQPFHILSNCVQYNYKHIIVVAFSNSCIVATNINSEPIPNWKFEHIEQNYEYYRATKNYQ